MAATSSFLGTVHLCRGEICPVSHAPCVRARLAIHDHALPIGFELNPAQGPYREALYARDFYFLSTWTWYHWLGLLAPLAIPGLVLEGKLRGTTPAFRAPQLCSYSLWADLHPRRRGHCYGAHQLDMFARSSRCAVFTSSPWSSCSFSAAFIGEYLAKDRLWVLPALFLPLAGGMFYVARQTYPLSAQIEFPWMKTSSNPWLNTLLWVRHNTPENAVFAVDSRYFLDPNVDVHGFRANSERAALADYFKDGGVVAMFPALAVEWKQMSDATYGLDHFRKEDFERLARQYPVTWTVIHGAGPEGMECPYQQDGYSVCRIPGAQGLAQSSPVIAGE
jgi:hypothetical protein